MLHSPPFQGDLCISRLNRPPALAASFDASPYRARPFGAARAVPLTQGDNVLFDLFSPSVRGRAARSAAGGLFKRLMQSSP